MAQQSTLSRELTQIVEVKVSAGTLRVIGILLLVTAAVLGVLNLKRVANLGMIGLPAPFLIAGVALLAASRRKSQSNP